MLQKPVVPLCPVTVNVRVVVDADWLDVRVAPEICADVMLPLICKLTVAPLLVVTCIVEVTLGVGVGVGVAVLTVRLTLVPCVHCRLLR